MMLLFAVLLVPAVLGATPCCVNNKFRANLYEVGGRINATGHPEIIDRDSEIYYDHEERMVRVDMTVNGFKMIVLTDYNNNFTYSIVDGICYKSATSRTFPGPCLPQNAEYLGYQRVGVNETFGVNTWRFSLVDGPSTNLTVKTTFTDDGSCTIVQNSYYGIVDGGPMEMTSFYTDVTVGALPAGTLRIPGECDHHTAGPAVGK